MTAAVLTAASIGTGFAQDVEKGESHSRNACPATPSARAPRTWSAPSSTASTDGNSGKAPDFNYTDANKNSGIVWDEATFKEYIKDPRAKIPGTKMIFAGIKNEQEVNDLWAYLKQFDAEGNIKK